MIFFLGGGGGGWGMRGWPARCQRLVGGEPFSNT